MPIPSKMVTIELKSKRSKISKLPKSINVASSDNVSSIIAAISKSTGLSIHRLRLTIPNSDQKPESPKSKKDTHLISTNLISSYLVSPTDDTLAVYVKDLGPQIGWRTVFFIEYFGPLLIHPLFFFFQKEIYGFRFEHSRAQQLTFIFVMLHFIKREYETAFVHHFSLDTMPVFNVFKNSAHYWLLSGLNIAYTAYAPYNYCAPDKSAASKFFFGRDYVPLGHVMLWVVTAFWLFCELSNGYCHLILSSLRADGSRTRKIPQGYGFNLVSVPNYFFEILSCFSIFLVSQNWSSLLFLVVSAGQMFIWAVKKHKRYRKEFGEKYPKNRKIIVPYLL